MAACSLVPGNSPLGIDDDSLPRTAVALRAGGSDGFLNGELFYSLREVRVLTVRWRVYFNTERPHSSLGYRPPVPEARLTKNMGFLDLRSNCVTLTISSV
ncbi:MAG: transposase [Bacillota bacterium]|nr:transposase [Bacillota bacterium]